MRLPARRRGRAKTPWVRGRREQEGQNRMGRGRGLSPLMTSPPSYREDRGGGRPHARYCWFQIMEVERATEWLSPSCILPRMTGGGKKAAVVKPFSDPECGGVWGCR